MDASTARSTRRARGSDHGLRPLMRSGDAIAGSGWEPRGVNANTKRPDPSATASGRPLRVLLTTDWWEPVVNGVVASVRTLRRAGADPLPGPAHPERGGRVPPRLGLRVDGVRPRPDRHALGAPRAARDPAVEP